MTLQKFTMIIILKGSNNESEDQIAVCTVL